MSLLRCQPGYIALLGSGETSPAMRAVYHWLFKELKAPIHVAILETPAGFEPNSAQVAGQIGQFIQHRFRNFAPQLAIIPARKKNTPFSPDNVELLAPLLQANVIFMGPGSPTYAVRQLENSATWYALQMCHRLGASPLRATGNTTAT